MKAMVLAAGEGTRLRPLTGTMPKPMCPVANVPLLTRTLRMLAVQGITEIAVNLYHRPEIIRESLGTGASLGVTLHYSDESTLMGTAGGVKRLESFLADDSFLILYGDNLYRFDYAPILDFHRKSASLATIATFTAPNPSACGLVVTDENGIVTRFQEKPPPEEVFTDQANAGVYILEPDVFSLIPPDTICDFGKDIFPELLRRYPGRMAATAMNGYLQDTGTIPSYRQANWDILEGVAGPAESGIHPGARIAHSATLHGRNVLGDRVIIGEECQLYECILWDNVVVGPGAILRNCILGRNVRIGAAARIEDGAVIADNVHIPDGTEVPANARISV
jgi:mannose-1-phosphate guanylyltransferase/phosphomannomutase